ncbi:MAG: hypothetical protein ABR608_03325 [Pseudonocardiaceae bacterium]
MSARVRGVLLAVLLVVFVATAAVAGRCGEEPSVAGVERLGPDAGEPVPAYLHRASEELPPPGAGPVWALIQPHHYLEPAAAAALATSAPGRPVRLSRVVLRVALPGVQTALISRDLPGQHPAEELAAAIRAAAQDRSRESAQAPAGSRSAAVAAAEASRLRGGCACVLALLVRADTDALRAVADRPEVRAVHAARPGTALQGLGVSPLLPEQRVVAGPVPDDGPVPP